MSLENLVLGPGIGHAFLGVGDGIRGFLEEIMLIYIEKLQAN